MFWVLCLGNTHVRLALPCAYSFSQYFHTLYYTQYPDIRYMCMIHYNFAFILLNTYKCKGICIALEKGWRSTSHVIDIAWGYFKVPVQEATPDQIGSPPTTWPSNALWNSNSQPNRTWKLEIHEWNIRVPKQTIHSRFLKLINSQHETLTFVVYLRLVTRNKCHKSQID